MILAHGGTAGGALEVVVLLVPMVVLALLMWRSRRQGVTDRQDIETADPDEP